MTILQVTFQPFGILNALRERFIIPLAVTCLLRVALFSPKESLVYNIIGTSSISKDQLAVSRWTHSPPKKWC